MADAAMGDVGRVLTRADSQRISAARWEESPTTIPAVQTAEGMAELIPPAVQQGLTQSRADKELSKAQAVNGGRAIGQSWARHRVPLPLDRMNPLQPEGPPIMIVAVLGTKGGVGATTVAANLATALAYGGLSVIALDLDSQNSLHLHLGLNPADISGLARTTLAGQDWSVQLRKAAGGRPGTAGMTALQVLPYGMLDEVDEESFNGFVASTPNWFVQSLQKLGLPHGTVVMVDLPARVGPLTAQVLRAAHVAISVSLADAASYVCASQIDRVVRNLCHNRPDFIGFRSLFNQVDHSSELGHDVARLLRQNEAGRIFGLVHRDQAVAEALACGTNVLDYDQSSQAAADMAACAQRLAQMLAEPGERRVVDGARLRQVV